MDGSVGASWSRRYSKATLNQGLGHASGLPAAAAGHADAGDRSVLCTRLCVCSLDGQKPVD